MSNSKNAPYNQARAAALPGHPQPPCRKGAMQQEQATGTDPHKQHIAAPMLNPTAHCKELFLQRTETLNETVLVFEVFLT